MHYRLVCLIISVMSADRIGLGITYKVFIFTRHVFMHTFFSIFPILNLYCVLFFLLYLSLSLSLIEPIYGTQIEKIHFASKSLSRFWVIFFCFSYYSFSHPIPWREGQHGLLWELPRPWRSSGTPGNSVGFCRHSSFQSHSDLELGISTWETHKVSCCVYSGFLLQHTQHSIPLCLSLLLHSEVHVL